MPKANLWCMSQLNQRLTKARELRSLSQTNLAERLGVTRTAVSHWEAGRSNPSTKHLEKIANVLGVDPSWLISGKTREVLEATHTKASKDNKSKDIVVLEKHPDYGVLFDQETLKVANSYFLLNRSQRKVIRDMIKALTQAS